MDSIQLLGALSDARGVSGFEDDVVAVARAHTPAGAAIEEDSMRNLYLRRAQPGGGPLVMLDAHSDEVGFLVQAVRKNGLLRVVPVGGWLPQSLPAHRMAVRSRDGAWLPAVFATKPPHFVSAAERSKAPEMADLTLDLGARSDEEVRETYGVDVGAPVVPDVNFSHNEKTGVMLGKALDCRAGCACLLEVFRNVYGETLGVEPMATLAAQEEVGTRGARVTARRVKPALALVFEGAPADDSFPDGDPQCALHGGPSLRHIDGSMITNPRLLRFALETARREDIPVQTSARAGGGTNAGAIHLSGLGVPVLVIGVPVRYIHTHYGFAALEDYQNCVRLGTALLKALSAEVIEGL